MKVKIENNNLIIEIPVEANPPKSSTGKSFLIASTHGTVTTDCQYNGKPVKVSLNAMVSAK